MGIFDMEAVLSNHIQTIKDRSEELESCVYTSSEKERGKMMHVLSLYLWQLVGEEGLQWIEDEELTAVMAMRQVIAQIKSYIIEHPLQDEETTKIVPNTTKLSLEERYRTCALVARRLSELYSEYTKELLFYKAMRYILAQREVLYNEEDGWATIDDIPVTVRGYVKDDGYSYVEVLNPYRL